MTDDEPTTRNENKLAKNKRKINMLIPSKT